MLHFECASSHKVRVCVLDLPGLHVTCDFRKSCSGESWRARRPRRLAVSVSKCVSECVSECVCVCVCVQSRLILACGIVLAYV